MAENEIPKINKAQLPTQQAPAAVEHGGEAAHEPEMGPAGQSADQSPSSEATELVPRAYDPDRARTERAQVIGGAATGLSRLTHTLLENPPVVGPYRPPAAAPRPSTHASVPWANASSTLTPPTDSSLLRNEIKTYSESEHR